MIGRTTEQQPMILFDITYNNIFNHKMHSVHLPALTAAAGLDKCPAPFADPLSPEPLQSPAPPPNKPFLPPH